MPLGTSANKGLGQTCNTRVGSHTATGLPPFSRCEGKTKIKLCQVIPFIDGVRYMKRIAVESGVHVDLVIDCLKHLLYFKCIAMIDIFQVLSCPHSFFIILSDSHILNLQPSIRMYMQALLPSTPSTQTDNSKTRVYDISRYLVSYRFFGVKTLTRHAFVASAPPPFEIVFKMYCALRPDLSVREFCQENDLASLKIDERYPIPHSLVAVKNN